MQLTETKPGADCGSDHGLFIAKLKFKLKKVRKTTRQFRYDPNQIPELSLYMAIISWNSSAQ